MNSAATNDHKSLRRTPSKEYTTKARSSPTVAKDSESDGKLDQGTSNRRRDDTSEDAVSKMERGRMRRSREEPSANNTERNRRDVDYKRQDSNRSNRDSSRENHSSDRRRRTRDNIEPVQDNRRVVCKKPTR